MKEKTFDILSTVFVVGFILLVILSNFPGGGSASGDISEVTRNDNFSPSYTVPPADAWDTLDPGADPWDTTVPAVEGSLGLDYALNDDGASYAVVGAGGCTDSHIMIPSTYDGLPVTAIGAKAFAYCDHITDVTIFGNITSIGEYAFGDSGLTSITIPGSVTSIGREAFSRCESLESVTLGYGVTCIEEYAFDSCSNLSSVTIPGSVSAILDGAFWNCTRLEKVTLEHGVETIGGQAFSYCGGLVSVNIPSSVTSIGEYAFYTCVTLERVWIGDGLKRMGYCAFSDCYNLSVVNFDGTTAQWKRITEGTDWSRNTSLAAVYCTDGNAYVS